VVFTESRMMTIANKGQSWLCYCSLGHRPYEPFTIIWCLLSVNWPHFNLLFNKHHLASIQKLCLNGLQIWHPIW